MQCWCLASQGSTLLPSGCALSTKNEFWLNRSYKRCPVVLLVMASEIKLLSFFWDIILTFFFVWRPFYIMLEALLPSLMVGRLFGLSWCPQGGDTVIITLQAAAKARERWLAITPVFSLCRRRNVGCDRLSGMTQQGLLLAVNDSDNISG